jgi:hypothetical protein
LIARIAPGSSRNAASSLKDDVTAVVNCGGKPS